MSTRDQPRSKRTALWMRITLLISLAVNLLILGAILGAVLGRDREGGPGDRLRAARDLAPPPFVLALEPSDRRDLVRSYREIGPDQPSRDEIRTRLQAILTELRAEAFDADALADLLADQRNRNLARQTAGSEVFVSHLSEMSHEDRQAYADKLESVLRRGAKR